MDETEKNIKSQRKGFAIIAIIGVVIIVVGIVLFFVGLVMQIPAGPESGVSYPKQEYDALIEARENAENDKSGLILSSLTTVGFGLALAIGCFIAFRRYSTDLISIEGIIVDKRTTSQRTKYSSIARYFVTIETEKGERIELGAKGEEYGLISNKDKVLIKYQGNTIRSFELLSSSVRNIPMIKSCQYCGAKILENDRNCTQCGGKPK